MNTIDELIQIMNKHKASHLHLGPEKPPFFRIDDKIKNSGLDTADADSIKYLLYEIMPERKVQILEQTGHIHFVYTSAQTNRYRISAYTHGKSIYAVFKQLSQNKLNGEILTAKELNLPQVVSHIPKIPEGLVICSGPENSGKTTTLASMINAANTDRKAHIITIENPIEYTHPNRSCLVEQLEIGLHVQSKQEGLRNAMDAGADVILCEGMDAETISLMFDAASGGRLVLTSFSQLLSAPGLIDKLFEIFPAPEDIVCKRFSNVFRASIGQQLFKRADRDGYCNSNEILISTPPVKNLIREKKFHVLPGLIQTGKKYGMQLMDDSIMDLYEKGWISAEDADMKANDKNRFRQFLRSPPNNVSFAEEIEDNISVERDDDTNEIEHSTIKLGDDTYELEIDFDPDDEDDTNELDLSMLELGDEDEIILRLKEAKRSNVLDLSQCRITELLEEIGTLNSLKTLYLNDNLLTSLPEDIGKLTNLEELDLSDNQLTSLPEGIEKLTNLTGLYLRHNQLISIPEDIGKLTNLTTLALSHNQLTSLPEGIVKLNNLEMLDLIGNQIKSLPKDIGKLTNLAVLTLIINQLTSLPEGIGELTNLAVLNLSDNQLTSLPQGIGKLTNLRELSLRNNQFTSIPANVEKLINLTKLFLNGNQITSIPVDKLTNLNMLDLRSNRITTLAEDIGELTNLTWLSLGENQLTRLPEDIGKLTNLIELDLSDNQLTSLPEDIGMLTNLTWLSLRNNQLKSLPVDMEKLTNLTWLDLEGCPLETPPPEIANPGLETLDDFKKSEEDET